MKSFQVISVSAVVALCLWSGGRAQDNTVSYRQDSPPEPAAITQQQREANVRLVFSYYRRGGDWSDKTMLTMLSPNFIQHDVCEPSTEQAYAKMFRDQLASGGMPESKNAEPQSQGMKDSAGHGLIRSIVADGDLVVVIRDLNRRWPGGPVPWMKTTFVDIWRVQNGKMTEQWASTVPGDGFSSVAGGNCKYYHDDPPSNPPAAK